MKTFLRVLFCVLVLPLMLAACGDKEADQRAAFIQFLQTKVVEPARLNVPKPSDDEKSAMGDYAGQYAVIADFHAALDKAFAELDPIMRKVGVRNLDELIRNRQSFADMQTALKGLQGTVATELSKADTAHAAMKLPDDLKAVYDKAYEKTVTAPAATVDETLTTVGSVLQSALAVADYVDQHKDKVTINGGMIEAADQQTQNELNALLEKLNASGQNMGDVLGKLNAMAFGR